MPDRTVYLVDEVTDPMIDHELTFVSDADLTQLTKVGWEVTTTLARTLRVAGKEVHATMMIIRRAEENRGVSVRQSEEGTGRRPEGVHGTMVVADAFGVPRAVSTTEMFARALDGMQRGLSNLGEHPGHLGAPGQHNMPGLTIISGTHISKAFDMGMLAGARGESSAANPFPPGTEASSKWLEGYAQRGRVRAQQASASEIKEAEVAGFKLAESMALDKDSQVTCPFSHPQLREAWVSGFKRGGGTVESGG